MMFVAFFIPPLYFLLRRRWLAFLFNSFLCFMGLVTIFFLGIGVLVGQQVTQLAQKLPEYQFTIQEKIRSLRDVASGGSTGPSRLGFFELAPDGGDQLLVEVRGDPVEPEGLCGLLRGLPPEHADAGRLGHPRVGQRQLGMEPGAGRVDIDRVPGRLDDLAMQLEDLVGPQLGAVPGEDLARDGRATLEDLEGAGAAPQGLVERRGDGGPDLVLELGPARDPGDEGALRRDRVAP